MYEMPEHPNGFNSNLTRQLDVAAVREKLLNLSYIQRELLLWGKS